MSKYAVVIVTDKQPEQCCFIDKDVFDPVYIPSPDQLESLAGIDDIQVIIVNYDLQQSLCGDAIAQLMLMPCMHEKSLVMMCNEAGFQQKIELLEAGVNDVIPVDEPVSEITTRLLREVYHAVANKQLKQQASCASDAAMAAMQESSNLGNNIQFLLKAHQCGNVDQLAQIFFQTMATYDLKCSLQMRSVFGVKNMETNGMARQMESDLLNELKSVGRYFDFGHRSVVNYGRVSVLVKNMPEDEMLYGLVKDNTFTLLQGMDARIKALDEHEQLLTEIDAVESISKRVNEAAERVGKDYHAVMLGIVDVVENMAEKITDKIPSLLLNEEQEVFIETIVQDCVLNSNKIFTEGFKVDSYFSSMREEINLALETAREGLGEDEAVEDTSMNESEEGVELF